MKNLTVGSQYTLWRSTEFNEKTYPRNDIVLEALQVGLSVLVVDIDMVFFGNPFPFLLQTYRDVDLATTQEHFYLLEIIHYVVHCIGVYFVNPTHASIKLHSKMKHFQGKKIGSNQQIMNHVMYSIMYQELRVAELDPLRFYDGFNYFGDFTVSIASCCQFAHDSCCPRRKALVLHSNNLKPKPYAKIYSFKEHLMWDIDDNR